MLAVLSDSFTVLAPLGSGTGDGISIRLAFLEAELARGSLVSDHLAFFNLGIEERHSNGVKREGDTLGNDVEGFELNVNSIIEISNLHLTSPGVTVLVVVEDGMGLFVVIQDEGKDLENEEHEDADKPHDEPDLANSVEERVKDGPGPSTHGESPEEGQNEPSNHAEVESDVAGSSHESPESHVVPRMMSSRSVHVLTSENIKVVGHVEDSKGSVDGPTHVS